MKYVYTINTSLLFDTYLLIIHPIMLKHSVFISTFFFSCLNSLPHFKAEKQHPGQIFDEYLLFRIRASCHGRITLIISIFYIIA